MRVIISPDAEADLADIGDFIAGDNPRRAVSFARELRARCIGLGQQPNRFSVVLRREDVAVRRIAYERYSIFYAVREGDVFILRILHAARDYEKIIFPED